MLVGRRDGLKSSQYKQFALQSFSSRGRELEVACCFHGNLPSGGGLRSVVDSGVLPSTENAVVDQISSMAELWGRFVATCFHLRGYRLQRLVDHCEVVAHPNQAERKATRGVSGSVHMSALAFRNLPSTLF